MCLPLASSAAFICVVLQLLPGLAFAARRGSSIVTNPLEVAASASASSSASSATETTSTTLPTTLDDAAGVWMDNYLFRKSRPATDEVLRYNHYGADYFADDTDDAVQHPGNADFGKVAQWAAKQAQTNYHTVLAVFIQIRIIWLLYCEGFPHPLCAFL